MNFSKRKLLSKNIIKDIETLKSDTPYLEQIANTVHANSNFHATHSKFLESIGHDFASIDRGKKFYDSLLLLISQSETVALSKSRPEEKRMENMKWYIIRKFGVFRGTELLYRSKKLKQSLKKTTIELQHILGESCNSTEDEQKKSIYKVIKSTMGMYLYKIEGLFLTNTLHHGISQSDKYNIIKTMIQYMELAWAFGSFYIVDDILDGDVIPSKEEKDAIFNLVNKCSKGTTAKVIYIDPKHKLASYLKSQLLILQKNYPYLPNRKMRHNLSNFALAQEKDAQLTSESDLQDLKIHSMLKGGLTRISVKEFATGKLVDPSDYYGFLLEGSINQLTNDFRTCLSDQHETIFTRDPEKGRENFLQYLLYYYKQNSEQQEIAGSYIKHILTQYVHYAQLQKGGDDLINNLFNHDELEIIGNIRYQVPFENKERTQLFEKVYTAIMK